MFRRALSSLRVQAVIWTVLPLVIIIALVGSVGVYSYNQVVGRLLQDRDSALALLSAGRLSQNLEAQGGVLQALANELSSNTCFDDSGTFNQQLCFAAHNGMIQRVVERCLLSDVDYLSLAYSEGDVVRTIQSTPLTDGSGCETTQVNNILGDNIYSAPYFIRPYRDEKTYFSDVVTPPNSDRPQVIISVPIIDSRGRFIGVLAGSYSLERGRIGEDIARLGVGKTYLLDRKGQVIWHTTPTERGLNWSTQPAFQALLGLNDNEAGAQTIVNGEGASVVVGYARVEATGWGLIIEEPWDTVLGPVRTFQWLILAALVVGLVLVTMIISSGTRRLTDPIRDLAAQAAQVAQGDMAGPVQGGTVQEIQALSAAFNDMTQKIALYRTGMQQYVAAITQSQEEERKRIARELHDDTIQTLIALGRRMELMEQSLENPIDAAIQLYQLQQMLNRTIAEVRQFSRDLRPLLLEDLGLVSAVRQMLRESERRDGVTTSFTVDGETPQQVDDEVTVATYRIAQEALSNIHKHAGAKRVDVHLAFGEKDLTLTVADDGKGFPVKDTSDLARTGSFGLMGIRERAKLFGGVLDITSKEGEGSQVTVRLPYTFVPERLIADIQPV